MNLGLGFLCLLCISQQVLNMNVLNISVREQMDIVTNHPLRLLIRFVLSFPLSASPFSNFASLIQNGARGKLHLCPGGQLGKDYHESNNNQLIRPRFPTSSTSITDSF